MATGSTITIEVAGKPVPWARHVGLGKAATEPAPQKAFKRTIAQAVQFGGARKVRGFEFYHLKALFYLPAPRDLAKRSPDVIASELLVVTKRPDLDNWLKLPLDALNGIVWKDDAQVVSFDGSRRFYSLRPRLELTIVGDGGFDPEAADAWARGKI